jgi:hypothetical protein
MKRLYVRFEGDNDYCNTMRGFVKAIAPIVLSEYCESVTKEQIVKAFNRHAYTFYIFHQQAYHRKCAGSPFRLYFESREGRNAPLASSYS